MLDYMLYLWIGFFILSVVLEAVTLNLIGVWFMPGTILAFLLALFGAPAWIQVLVWLCVTVIVCLSTFRFTKRIFNRRATPTNADRVLGKEALVTEIISAPDQSGQVKVLGQIWSARCSDPNTVIPVGTTVRVLRIEGVTLIVESI